MTVQDRDGSEGKCTIFWVFLKTLVLETGVIEGNSFGKTPISLEATHSDMFVS